MGRRHFCIVVLHLVIPFVVISPLLTGCQLNAPPAQALVEHREQIDDVGLAEQFHVEPLKAVGSFPMGWQPLKLQQAALYTHQQWRSPTKRTAVGITYVRMPLPLATKTLVWFAIGEVGKKVDDGKVLRQWTDPIGREWFEAENAKYHMTGYVMTRGFDAWINYCGYRVAEPMEPAEVALGTRALDSILPEAVNRQHATALAQ